MAGTFKPGQAGTNVIYFSSNGKAKVALVVGDPETITVNEVGGPNDGAVPAILNEGERHLVVFSPTGSVYIKHNVPEGQGPNTWTPLATVPSEA